MPGYEALRRWLGDCQFLTFRESFRSYARPDVLSKGLQKKYEDFTQERQNTPTVPFESEPLEVVAEGVWVEGSDEENDTQRAIEASLMNAGAPPPPPPPMPPTWS